MIVGIGVDVVDLARFERAIARTPGLVERLFAESERGRHPRSLAARFAAKEALIKALGGPGAIRWHDMVIVSNEHGDPDFELGPTVRRIADELGVSRLHVSMSHDGGVATAFVVAERDA